MEKQGLLFFSPIFSATKTSLHFLSLFGNNKPVSDIIIIDISQILNSLPTDSTSRHDLHVVERNIRVKTILSSFLSEFDHVNAAWPIIRLLQMLHI